MTHRNIELSSVSSAIAAAIVNKRLGEGRKVHIPSLGMTISWRPDGWPICPQCDEDELYSLLHWNGEGDKPPLEDWIRAGLKCYLCGWSNEP